MYLFIPATHLRPQRHTLGTSSGWIRIRKSDGRRIILLLGLPGGSGMAVNEASRTGEVVGFSLCLGRRGAG